MSTLTTDSLASDLAGLMTQGGFPATAEQLTAHLDEPFENWEMDSLGHMELMVALGRRYGITIADSETQNLQTPGATLDFLRRTLGGED
jgi:acyl carrier protein